MDAAPLSSPSILSGNQLTISPIPVHSQITIDGFINEEATIQIRLISLLGQQWIVGDKLKNKSDYLESIYNIAFCYDEMNESQKGKDLVIKTLNTFEKSNYTKELSCLNFYLSVYYSTGNRDLEKA
jgi:hypothetical protein